MNLFKSILAPALIVCLSASVSYPQARGDIPLIPLENLKSGDLESSPDLKKGFETWRKAIDAGDEAGSFSESNRMLEVINKLGTRNLFILSDMCMAVGKASLAGNNLQGAYLAAKHATFFAPDDPAAHFFLARAIFEKNKTDIKGVGVALASGIKAMARDRFHRDRFISAAALLFSRGALLTFAIVFAALFALNFKAVIANMVESFPALNEGKWKYAAGFMLILIPLAAGGWQLFIIALPLFIWPTLRLGEKFVVSVFALLAFSAPYATDYIAKGATLAGADTYRALYLLSGNTWDYETKMSLERELAANPDDKVVAFALGLLNKLSKNKEASVKAFDAVLAADPEDVRTLVNKGNAYYIAREYDNAAAMYRKAMEAQPQSVEAYFNLSVTMNEMLLTKDSEAEYNKALAIDPELTRKYVAMTKEQDHDKRIVDFPITAHDLEAYSRSIEMKTGEVSTFTWNAWMGSTSMKTYKGIALGLILLLAFSQILWMKKISNYVCGSCGAVFHPAIRLAGEAPHCNQCVAAQISKAGVSSAKKDKKKKEIREYKEGASRLAGILDRMAPGVGRLYAHDSVSGLLFTFITCTLVVYGAVNLAADFMSAQPASALQYHALYLVLAALYWALMNTALKKDFY
ncbi:MAG: hypothetical protein HZB29_14095 [Nitrospinae bacterium]|nr:hypothetical protein [Nitrospinota bacterium]